MNSHERESGPKANDYRFSWAILYILWATIAIALSLLVGGFSSENTTRLLVIAFLLVQLKWQRQIAAVFTVKDPQKRFVYMGMVLAAIVEGFHMISVPVFSSVRITHETSYLQGVIFYLTDLAFTLPAYYLIFSLIWFFIQKYTYSLWQYIFVMGLGQVIGDGGLFYFLGAPGMLLFLPYPMSNYHAVNILPFLLTRNELPSKRITSWRAFLATPALILLYLFCGTIIKIVGKWFGYI